MKVLNLILFLFFIVCFSKAQTNKPGLKNPPFVMKSFKYDKVIAYKCQSKPRHNFIVGNDGKLDTSIIADQKKLSIAQVDSLHKFLSGNIETNVDFKKECYTPYLAFVYYLNNQIVADFNISPVCNMYYFYFRTLEKPNDWPNTKRVFTKQQGLFLDNLSDDIGLNFH